MQKVIKNENGILEFKANKIVQHIFENSSIDMNKIVALMQGHNKFSTEDYEQFLQLTGYSLDGFMELSLVSDKTKDEVDQIQTKGELKNVQSISKISREKR